MVQMVTRIDDDLARKVDDLIAAGVVSSRSEAVRQGLKVLLDQHRRRSVAASIVEGYRLHPQREAEVGWADEATVRMITDEPW